MTQKLEISDLHVEVEGKKVLKGVNLSIAPGEVHALMGPNGSGKSTLAQALIGHPRYEISHGGISLNGKNLVLLKPEERATNGLFLAFQYPLEIPGVRLFNLLYESHKSLRGQSSAVDFLESLRPLLNSLVIDEGFLKRSVNEGFSGGEKKKAEILQMLSIHPKYAVLDETDSGLDVDALKIVAAGAKSITTGDTPAGLLVITHYQRILEYIVPDFVHILVDGKIVASGGKELVEKVEREGYGNLSNF